MSAAVLIVDDEPGLDELLTDRTARIRRATDPIETFFDRKLTHGDDDRDY